MRSRFKRPVVHNNFLLKCSSSNIPNRLFHRIDSSWMSRHGQHLSLQLVKCCWTFYKFSWRNVYPWKHDVLHSQLTVQNVIQSFHCVLLCSEFYFSVIYYFPITYWIYLTSIQFNLCIGIIFLSDVLVFVITY